MDMPTACEFALSGRVIRKAAYPARLHPHLIHANLTAGTVGILHPRAARAISNRQALQRA